MRLYQLNKDRVPYFSSKIPFWSYNANVATFVILRHPVTVLVADFTNLIDLTNDLLVINPLNYCYTLNKTKQPTLSRPAQNQIITSNS